MISFFSLVFPSQSPLFTNEEDTPDGLQLVYTTSNIHCPQSLPLTFQSPLLSLNLSILLSSTPGRFSFCFFFIPLLTVFGYFEGGLPAEEVVEGDRDMGTIQARVWVKDGPEVNNIPPTKNHFPRSNRTKKKTTDENERDADSFPP